MEYSADKVPGPEYGSHKGCDKQLTFSKTLKSEQCSLRMKIAYGCILGYVSLQTKLAIGFVRFESLRGGFVDSRFESRGLDSWIFKFTQKVHIF